MAFESTSRVRAAVYVYGDEFAITTHGCTEGCQVVLRAADIHENNIILSALLTANFRRYFATSK